MWLPEQPVFDFVRECGNVEPDEMFRTFNMGVGMLVVVPPEEADAVCRAVDGWWEPGRRPSTPRANRTPSPTLAPLAALAAPPRRAGTIGEMVPEDQVARLEPGAAPATRRRLVILD